MRVLNQVYTLNEQICAPDSQAARVLLLFFLLRCWHLRQSHQTRLNERVKVERCRHICKRVPLLVARGRKCLFFFPRARMGIYVASSGRWSPRHWVSALFVFVWRRVCFSLSCFCKCTYWATRKEACGLLVITWATRHKFFKGGQGLCFTKTLWHQFNLFLTTVYHFKCWCCVMLDKRGKQI